MNKYGLNHLSECLNLFMILKRMRLLGQKVSYDYRQVAEMLQTIQIVQINWFTEMNRTSHHYKEDV